MGGAGAGEGGFNVRCVGDPPLGNFSAVGPAADGQLFRIGDAPRDEVIDTCHGVPVIAAAPVATIHLHEFLAVTVRPANIGTNDPLAPRPQHLPPPFDGFLPSAPHPALAPA